MLHNKYLHMYVCIVSVSEMCWIGSTYVQYGCFNCSRILYVTKVNGLSQVYDIVDIWSWICYKQITVIETLFSISLIRIKVILLFLWKDSWLVSGKICSTWLWVVQFLPGQWPLLPSLSQKVSYMCVCLHVHVRINCVCAYACNRYCCPCM